MSQGYQQTFLFDCSRLGSEEYNGSTLGAKQPARFTNKVSSGIKLDVGDQVSVHSAYISERGAGGDVIEFKGKSLKARSEINFTTTSDTVFTKDTKITPFGFSKQTNINGSAFVDMRDNEASIVISYYKNANGENYNGLPRDWGDYINTAANASTAVGSQLVWDESDGNTIGAQPVDRNASHYFPDDFQEKEINLNGTDATATSLGKRPFIRQDNGRFTIFCFDEIIWNGSDIASADVIDYCQWMTGGVGAASAQDPSPALRNYVKYKSRIDLSVDKGYNAPSNVALAFTDKLGSVTRRYIPQDVASFVQESQTLKAFPAANIDLFSRENASVYFGDGNHKGVIYANASFSNYKAIDYLSCYAYVGFKRPEFIEKGRELNDFYGFQVRESPPGVKSDLLTNIPWDFDNLTKLKNLFDIEHDLYPELIKRQVTRGVNDSASTVYQDYTNGSDNFLFEARFLHVDSASHFAGRPLGDDNMNGSSAGTLVKDKGSMPIFFYFNNSASNIIYNEGDPSTLNNLGERDSNLVFGFARQWQDPADSKFYVSFSTEKTGGISTWYGRSTMLGRKIGYDYHFNAYGNAAIQLTTGYAPCSYYGQETFGSGSHLASGSDTEDNRYPNSVRQVYIGANEPLLNFDTVETRFAFSDLHSPEQVGNFWNAGRTQGSDTQFAPPIAAGTGPVYHINKTLEYNTYSPHMLPYPSINISARVGSASGSTYAAGFLPLSDQLEAGVIYDSHCGVTIEDFGFDEVHWEEGLWGILGFTYNQFQGTNNLQTRFDNDTTNVSGATTNALITSTDTKELMSSVWGTNLFNQQVPTIMRYNFNGSWVQGSASTTAFNASVVHPSITVAQNSTEIKAQNLPRKQLRGYFLIKSDILSDANYYKEADPMPVFAVIDKYNAEGDFINYSGGGPSFTVTQPKQLTEIATTILDPDGTDAVVSDYSAVVYRVDKQINTDLLVAQDVLKNS